MGVRLWGEEQVVHTASVDEQASPRTTVLVNGRVLVVWEDEGGSLFGRTYTPDGAAFGDVFVLTSAATLDTDPAVVALANGNFSLIWRSGESDAVVNVYSPTGSLVVAQSPIAGAAFAEADALEGGGGVFVYANPFQVTYQRLSTTGTTTGAPVRVDTGSSLGVPLSDVAGLPGGGFVVAWSQTDGSFLTTVRTRVYDAAFAAADPITVGVGSAPKVARLANGDHAVAWTGPPANGVQGGSGQDVYVRLLSPLGSIDGPVLANGRTAGNQVLGDVVALPDGGFVVVWSSDADDSVRAQHFSNTGAKLGAEIAVSGSRATVTDVRGISATLMDDGRVAVAWSADDSAAGNADDDVYLQIIDPRDGYIEGTNAVDVLYGSALADQVTARAGSDDVFAGGGDDEVRGGGGADDLYGEAGDDLIYGDADNDELFGGAGDDDLRGGFGNDIIDGGLGADAIDGGPGLADRALYIDRTEAVTVMLTGATISVVRIGGVIEDTLVNIENVAGGQAGDTLYGDAVSNILLGNGGDDLIRGGVGNDIMDGGDGMDIVDYREKTVAVSLTLADGMTAAFATVGGALEDVAIQMEAIYGGTVGDVLGGNASANGLNGFAGDDVLRGGGGADLLVGGLGVDTADFRDKATAVALTLAGANNAVATIGGVAEDTLREVEAVYGGSAADTLTGDGNANLFRGGGGADVIDGGGGIDAIDFRDKTVPVTLTLAGGAVATATVGGVAEDMFRLIEVVYGGTANDILTGDNFANQLLGGDGLDTLRGLGGADVLTGGAGADLFVYNTLAESGTTLAQRDTLADFSVGSDKIRLTMIDANATVAGDQAFTVGALAVNQPGRLSITADGTARWLIEGDVNGDAVADLAILVLSAITPTAADFQL